MKNKIRIICAVIISCLVLASFSPSLDGRAVVADEGTFPQGLFAKTVGYLPGDSITVSNLSTKKTIDILVVGALDPSEGVAILLSPEAAFALGIEKNSNIIVKITKRSGQLDEAVSGTAVIANGTAAEADNTAVPAGTESAEKSDVPAADAAAPAVTADAVPAENAAPETGAKDETKPESEEDAAPPETIAATGTSEQPETVSDTEPEGAAADNKASDETETAAAEKVEGEASREEAVPASDAETVPAGDKTAEEQKIEAVEKVNEPIPVSEEAATPAVPEAVTAEKKTTDEPETSHSEKIDESISPLQETAEPERTTETAAPEDEVAAEPYTEGPDEKNAEAAAAPEAAKPVPEKVDEQPSETNVPVAAAEPVREKPVAEDVPASGEKKVSGSDSYAPIILVPAEPNPPESTKTEPVPEKLQESSAAAQKIVPPAAVGSGEFDKYSVPNLKALESGKYYIQIGVYADVSNIREVMKKYSEKYPMTIVPLASGIAKQIMIGPLSVDEYAAVIERFKSYGFKDAFLRKIK